MTDKRLTLDELLADPMVQLMITRSRSQPEEVRMLMVEAAERSAGKPGLPPAHVIAATRSHWCCA